MRNTFTYISLAAAIMVAACFTACEKVEVSTGDEVPEEIVTPAITMSVNATKVGETKALSDDGSAITSTWTQGDEVEVWTSDGTTTKYGTITAQNSGPSTRLSGTLDSTPSNGESLLLKYLSPNYSTQDGTLTDSATSIDKVCDYATATVTATVAGSSVTTNDATFTSQQAILKLNLKSDGNVDITSGVRQLTVTLGGQTVTVNRTPAAGPVYVAVPAASGSIVFYAAKGKDLYTKSVSKTLTAGHLYPVNLSMSIVEGALSGLFSVSASKKVYFSKGNLEAVFMGSGGLFTWQFFGDQWGCVGNAAANNAITGNGTVSTAGSVDLFGWSSTKTTYGIHNSTTGSDYEGDFRDWGTNAINNGGNAIDLWCTLNDDEWRYLIYNHTWGRATVADVCGLIILPDNYSGTAINTPGNNSRWNTNTIDASSWASNYEAYGAVFLPAAGYRHGMYIDHAPFSNEKRCYYWSSGSFSVSGGYYMEFGPQNYGFEGTKNYLFYGMSVRLVRVAN